jgi:hypothetical protein
MRIGCEKLRWKVLSPTTQHLECNGHCYFKIIGEFYFMNKEKRETKEKKESLVWVDSQPGETFHAGVAFFIEEFGEYRLVLDAPRTVLYLRPNELRDGQILYSVHALIENNGRFSHRVEVGNGYSSAETDNYIYMKLGRYPNQRLVLETSKGE